MTYKRIHAWVQDYNTFIKLKLKKQIELERTIDTVEFFHMILEEYQKSEAQKENLKNLDARISDGVTG